MIEKNNNIDKLDEEKENKKSVDDKNEVEIKNKKKEKEDADLKRENSKNEDRNSNENKENDLNDINIDNKKPKRKNDLNKIKDLNGKNEETIPSIESKIQKSNYISNNDPESEEFEKILKTEPNNSSHKLKKENKSKNKNKSPSNKSKSKKPINNESLHIPTLQPQLRHHLFPDDAREHRSARTLRVCGHPRSLPRCQRTAGHLARHPGCHHRSRPGSQHQLFRGTLRGTPRHLPLCQQSLGQDVPAEPGKGREERTLF